MLIERQKNSLAHVRVLVVEDDAIMRQLIVSILNSIGIETIVTANDGVQAWRMFQQGEKFDLVICDWMMPAMDGLEVLRNIRAGNSAIPFILVTIRDSEDALKNAVDRGVTAFVAKPFTPEQLIDEVLRVVGDTTDDRAALDMEVWEF